MPDKQTILKELAEKREKLRRAIQEKASIETQLLMEYLDIRHDEVKAEFQDIKNAYESVRGMGTMVRWLAGLGASVAMIWAAFHGGKAS
ncbi:MAG: hypothetical protein ACYDCF_10110 [Burkholderiales bacterium]